MVVGLGSGLMVSKSLHVLKAHHHDQKRFHGRRFLYDHDPPLGHYQVVDLEA